MIRGAKLGKYGEMVIHSFRGTPHWRDIGPIGFGDGSGQNRPKGGSTGCMFVGMGPMDILNASAPRQISPIIWESWRLQRVARSSNDAEIQSISEAENIVYKSRIPWAELNGFNAQRSLQYDSLQRGRTSAAE